MNVFIVYAHQEPQSFNSALKEQAISTANERGHQVIVSDLHAMNFKAVADQEDFISTSNPHFFKYGTEQRYAYENGLLAPDIVAEQQKLASANLVIFIFPFWWHSVPAIMKGWFDRVLTPGFSYSKTRIYDTGPLKGKRAMLVTTTSATREKYQQNGILGPMEQHLLPIQHGILHYTGMQVLPPFIVWEAAHITAEERQVYLAKFRQKLMALC